MRRTTRILAALLAVVFSLHAAAPPRGSDRLRELVVFPEINLNFSFYFWNKLNSWGLIENEDLPGEISRLRKESSQSPDDPQGLLHLGQLLEDNGETNAADSCYLKAAQLCQNKVADNPDNGLSWSLLGTAQRSLGKKTEAENAYRRATTVAPAQWQGWVALGNFLSMDSTLAFFPDDLRALFPPSTLVPSQAAMDYQPTPAALARSEAECHEAAGCFDRAIALAPGEAEVYVQHAGYLSISNWQNCFVRHFRNHETILTNEWTYAFFSEGTIANLQKAAALNPQNCQYVSLIGYIEWIHAVAKAGADPSAWPDKTRQSVQNAMTDLENFSENANQQLAAEALANLGCLHLTFGDFPAATSNFRRAVALNPANRPAWDMLIGLQIQSASQEDMVVICQSRLKYDNSARNHIILARALQHQKKWGLAGEQAEAALAIEPDNLPAQNELIALALEQSDHSDYLKKAGDRLGRLVNVLQKTEHSHDFSSNWRVASLNLAIYYGLSGDSEAARKCLTSVYKYFPNDQQANAIADALN